MDLICYAIASSKIPLNPCTVCSEAGEPLFRDITEPGKDLAVDLFLILKMVIYILFMLNLRLIIKDVQKKQVKTARQRRTRENRGMFQNNGGRITADFRE